MLKSYVVGRVLAFVLTAVPFGLVATRVLEPAPTLAVIAVLGVVKVAVHLRYFLHLDLTPSSRPELLVLAFAAILIVIMIGGSVAYTSMVLHAGDFDGESLATARGAYRLFRAAHG